MLLALHGYVYICVTKCFHGACFMVLFHHQIGLGSIRVISERGSTISQIIPPWSEISAGGCSCSIISIPYLVDFSQLVDKRCYCEGIHGHCQGVTLCGPLCGHNLTSSCYEQSDWSAVGVYQSLS